MARSSWSWTRLQRRESGHQRRRRNRLAPLGLLLVGLAACAAPADRSLVGLWESASLSAGGVGHTLEFKPDGSFVSAFAVMVQLAYRLDQGTLFTAGDAAALASEKEGARLVIQGDTLTLTDPKDATLRKERVGPVEDPSRPIVGVWRYKHDSGAVAYERYTRDGQLSFRLPISSNRGCYAASGGTVTVEAERTRPASFTARVEGDSLDLRREGKDTRYRRAPSAWYARE